MENETKDGAAAAPTEKKRRAYATVLVVVPGWPAQDPDRPMIYTTRSTPSKAARQIKRLRRQMPEFNWSQEMLTDTETRLVKLKPFKLGGDWACPAEVRPTTHGSKVVTLPSDHEPTMPTTSPAAD